MKQLNEKEISSENIKQNIINDDDVKNNQTFDKFEDLDDVDYKVEDIAFTYGEYRHM